VSKGIPRTLARAKTAGILQDVSITAFVANGALTVTNGRKNLNKPSIGAYTLAAPANDGDTVTIFAGTAFAHVVTATGLLDNGVTGGAKNTLTFAAFVGSCARLFASNGHWIVQSLNNVTVA
jgi:hypothetical protein